MCLVLHEPTIFNRCRPWLIIATLNFVTSILKCQWTYIVYDVFLNIQKILNLRGTANTLSI